MRFTTLIAALASLTSIAAIEVHLHPLQSCRGNSVICRDINPTDCCSPIANLASTSPPASPPAPSLRNGTSLAKPTTTGTGAPDICLSASTFNFYSAGRYYFPGKRARGVPAKAECNRVRPGVLGLANGTEFDLSGLDDVALEEIAGFLRQDDAEDELLQQIQVLELRRLS